MTTHQSETLMEDTSIENLSSKNDNNSEPVLKDPPPIPRRPTILNTKIDLRKGLGIENDSEDKPPIPPKNIRKSLNNVEASSFSDTSENYEEEFQPPIRSVSTSSLPPKRELPPLPNTKPIDLSKSENDKSVHNESLSESESSNCSLIGGIRSGSSSYTDFESLNDDEVHKKRTNIVNEILQTERTYIKILKELIDVWMQPILNQNPNEPIVPPDLIKFLFSNVEIILNVNKQFLQDFEAQMNHWSPTQCVGEVFLTLIPFFKVYMQYVNNYNLAMEIYQDLFKKKIFKKYIEDCVRQGTQYDNLPSYLITPIQRIPRYQLLLSELYRYTPQTHSDYTNIEKALEKIKTVAEEINAHKRDAENLNQCAIIQNELIYSDQMKKKQKKLVTPTRRFVNQGHFDILINGVKCPYNYLVLFNDSLLISKKKKKGLLYFGFLYLNRISVDIVENGITIKPHSFKDVTIHITFHSDEEKNTWVEGLSKNIKDFANDDDEDELRLSLLSEHGKKDTNESDALQKKKSFMRILKLGKSKDKIKNSNENETPRNDETQLPPYHEIKVNTNFNDELAKKLEKLKSSRSEEYL